jgi:hypothetical protein
MHRDKFLIIKPTRCANFSNLFWKETHVSGSSSVHHQEFFTVHTAMVYVIQVFRQHTSRIRLASLILHSCCLKTCMTYTIAVCTVKNSCWWTEELPETCRVSFQNKFEKLAHLVGFIIRNFKGSWSVRCVSHWKSPPMFAKVSLVPIYRKLETLLYAFITQLNRTGVIPKAVVWLKILVASLVSLSLLFKCSLKNKYFS